MLYDKTRTILYKLKENDVYSFHFCHISKCFFSIYTCILTNKVPLIKQNDCSLKIVNVSQSFFFTVDRYILYLTSSVANRGNFINAIYLSVSTCHFSSIKIRTQCLFNLKNLNCFDSKLLLYIYS